MSSAQSIERLAKVGVTFFLLLLSLAIAPAASLATLCRTMIFAGSAPRGHAFSRKHEGEICAELCRKTCDITSHVGVHKEKPDLAGERTEPRYGLGRHQQ